VYVHNISRGTHLTLTFENGFEYHAVFDGNIDHMSFYVICPEIQKDLERFIETTPQVKFLAGELFYTFTASIVGKSQRSDAIHDTMDFKITTPFKEEQRRTDFRIEIALKVKIHSYVDDFRKLYTGEWLCEAVSSDVSKHGIRIFADQSLDGPLGTLYTLEFSLRTGWIYLVPAKLVRNQRNMETRSYAFDYGFVFDFTNMPEKEEKLLLDILEAKIRNRA